MVKIGKEYRQEDNIPKMFHHHLDQQRNRLKEVKEKFGEEIISPFNFK